MSDCAALVEQIRGGAVIDEYARNLRGDFRAYWAGTVDYDQFFDLLLNTVRIGITRSWYAGAQECGIEPSELTPEEKQALQTMIFNESGHINEIAIFIETNNKQAGVKLAVVLQRAALWATRALDAQNQARLMACGDKKLKWVRGPTSDSCKTCLAMDGKVKRASYWQAYGPHPQAPQNHTIDCGGWHCLCVLQVTDEPMSKGPLPRWP